MNESTGAPRRDRNVLGRALALALLVAAAYGLSRVVASMPDAERAAPAPAAARVSFKTELKLAAPRPVAKAAAKEAEPKAEVSAAKADAPLKAAKAPEPKAAAPAPKTETAIPAP